ncbi:hypothetical protein GGI20_002093 [Coemansia sp. BCRC 34301]|nr:hypothetical protein GGI20_002093 [Coemansia sp. BCRC 34301]
MPTEFPTFSNSAKQSVSQVESATSVDLSAPLVTASESESLVNISSKYAEAESSTESVPPLGMSSAPASMSAELTAPAPISALALDTSFAPWSPYMSMLPSGSPNVVTGPLSGMDELGSIYTGAYGSSVALQEQSLSLDFSGGMSFLGSAAGLLPSSNMNAMSTASAPIIVSESNSALPEATQSEKPEQEGEDVDEESMTMATAPLPFPPFGGPQHQQESPLSADSISASVTLELAALPTATAAGIMETIDIVSASNDNALESSIDAILHSVIQDYKTESNPKAAVGFALIHPRRQAATSGRHM